MFPVTKVQNINKQPNIDTLSRRIMYKLKAAKILILQMTKSA